MQHFLLGSEEQLICITSYRSRNVSMYGPNFDLAFIDDINF